MAGIARHLLILSASTFVLALAVLVAVGLHRFMKSGSLESWVSMERLRSGEATPLEWTQVVATTLALVVFPVVFLSAGLVMTDGRPIGLAFGIVPVLWLGRIVREAWSDWRAARGATGPPSST